MRWRLATAAVIGIVFPYIELGWKCRQGFEASEACVWGRAYFPLTRWVEPIIVAPIAFLLLTAVSYIVARGFGSGGGR